MITSDVHKLIKLLKVAPDAKLRNTLEDLQYNLDVFLNEDVYIEDFELNDKASLFWISFFEQHKLIYISTEEERILLTPKGEGLLIEINLLLFYVD